MEHKHPRQTDEDPESSPTNGDGKSDASPKKTLDQNTEECLSMLLIGVFGGVFAYRQILRIVGDSAIAAIQKWGMPDYVLIAGAAVSVIVFPGLRVFRRIPMNLIFLIAAILGLLLGGIVVYMIAPAH